MNKIVGFIGGGNMARAIIGGILNAELISKENIMGRDILMISFGMNI